jgi:hypothetical protein
MIQPVLAQSGIEHNRGRNVFARLRAVPKAEADQLQRLPLYNNTTKS